MRILWIGDAADTGFGTVTRNVGRRLLDAGHDVRFVMQNLQVEPIPEPFASRSWNRTYVTDADLAAVVSKGFWRDGWKPDQAVILADMSAARATINVQPEAWREIPVWHYCPIEGTDLPPQWSKVWEFIHPIAMTHFGAAQIAQVIKFTPPVIYHGVDQSIFHPLSPVWPGEYHGPVASKREAKERFDLNPDHFVLLKTDRYMPRKGYNALLRAIAPVLMERDDVDFIIHCRTIDLGGVMEDTLTKFPQRVLDHIKLSRGHTTFYGVAPATLNVLYGAADIYLNSGAEGFGLTVAEAVACGVAVLGVDYSTVPEVAGPAGRLVPYDHLYDNEYNHYWPHIDEQAYGQALRSLLEPGVAAALGAKGPAHAAEHFSWDKAAEQFEALFRDAADVSRLRLTDTPQQMSDVRANVKPKPPRRDKAKPRVRSGVRGGARPAHRAAM